MKISVNGVGALVVELVDRVSGPEKVEFMTFPVKPTLKRLATPLEAPAKYSDPEAGLV